VKVAAVSSSLSEARKRSLRPVAIPLDCFQREDGVDAALPCLVVCLFEIT